MITERINTCTIELHANRDDGNTAATARPSRTPRSPSQAEIAFMSRKRNRGEREPDWATHSPVRRPGPGREMAQRREPLSFSCPGDLVHWKTGPGPFPSRPGPLPTFRRKETWTTACYVMEGSANHATCYVMEGTKCYVMDTQH